jgi:hypothetical protein
MSAVTFKRANPAKREPESMPNIPELLRRNAENISTPANETVVGVSDIESMVSGALTTSVLKIEQLIAQLAKSRDHMEEKAHRIEREVFQYLQLHHEVRDIAKVITDSLSDWRNSGPVRLVQMPGSSPSDDG